MENKRRVVKQLFYPETSIESKFTYKTFLKKGLRTFSSFALKCGNANHPREEGITDPKSTTLVKLFKKIKLTKKVDLSQLQVLKPIPSVSAFLYIVKRMSHVRALSIYDHRGKETSFKGLFATCPKYMKKLKSLDSQIRIQSSAGFFTQAAKVPKKILFQSDFLRFLPSFEGFKVTFPFFQYFPQMNRVFQFKKFPISMRKISLHHPNCRPAALKVSIEHLKELRDFEIILMPETTFELANAAYKFTSQVPVKLQVLKVNFDQEFYIDAEIHKAIKRLVNLKKVKFQLSSVRFADNLQILEDLKECPLESLGIKMTVQDEQTIVKVKDFILKKETTLKKIEFCMVKDQGLFKSHTILEELGNVIDNLPQLVNFYLLLKAPQPRSISLELAFPFKKLFEKPIPLREFQLISNQLAFSLDLLDSLQGIAPHLGKLQIDIGKYEPQSPTEADVLCEFLRSLVNIQVLKLESLFVSKQNFSKMIDTILALRYLTDLALGQFSEEIPEPTLITGIEKILGKYGFRNFDGSVGETIRLGHSSSPWVQILNGRRRETIPQVDLVSIKRKNPYLQVYPSMLLSSRLLLEESW